MNYLGPKKYCIYDKETYGDKKTETDNVVANSNNTLR